MKGALVIFTLLMTCVYAKKNMTANERFDRVVEDLLDSFGDSIQPLVMSGYTVVHKKEIYGKVLTFSAGITSVNMSGIDSAKRIGSANFTRGNGSNSIVGAVGMSELSVIYVGHIRINGHGPTLTTHYKVKGFEARFGVSQTHGTNSTVRITTYKIVQTGTYVITRVDGIPRNLKWIARKGMTGVTRKLKESIEERLQTNMDSSVGKLLNIHFKSLE